MQQSEWVALRSLFFAKLFLSLTMFVSDQFRFLNLNLKISQLKLTAVGYFWASFDWFPQEKIDCNEIVTGSTAWTFFKRTKTTELKSVARFPLFFLTKWSFLSIFAKKVVQIWSNTLGQIFSNFQGFFCFPYWNWRNKKSFFFVLGPGQLKKWYCQVLRNFDQDSNDICLVSHTSVLRIEVLLSISNPFFKIFISRSRFGSFKFHFYFTLCYMAASATSIPVDFTHNGYLSWRKINSCHFNYRIYRNEEASY